MDSREIRRVYLAFEFERDAQRRTLFIQQASVHCEYLLEDLSLPSAIHNSHWQREARNRIQNCHVLIVLLGQDTHSSNGVRDEVSLAGQAQCPIIQLMPQHQRYGLISGNIPLLSYRWVRLNEMLRNPNVYIRNNRISN